MSRKLVLVMTLTFVLVGMLAVASEVQRGRASGTIYIRSDGSVEGTDKIQRDGDVYTFTDDLNETIAVEKDNIVIDGNGYRLEDQTGQLNGFNLNGRSGVTIKNTHIIGFDYGIWLSSSDDNTISGNNITNNYNGIYVTLFSNGNTIKENNVTNNANFGISIVGDSFENLIYHNNFIDNGYQQASSQLTNTWDNGVEGNY
jgi:parallel beta-helix repeat protein